MSVSTTLSHIVHQKNYSRFTRLSINGGILICGHKQYWLGVFLHLGLKPSPQFIFYLQVKNNSKKNIKDKREQPGYKRKRTFAN